MLKLLSFTSKSLEVWKTIQFKQARLSSKLQQSDFGE